MATISGTSSDDTLTGADGPDTAAIASLSPLATFKLDAQGRWVVSSTQGTDTLVDIENVAFKDGGVALTRPRDLPSSVYAASGFSVAMLKNGNHVFASPTTISPLDANAQPIGAGFPLDFGPGIVSPSATQVAALSGGGYVVVAVAYDSVDTKSGNLYAQRFDASGAKVGGAIELARGSGTHNTFLEGVSVVGTSNGGFTVTYEPVLENYVRAPARIVSVDAAASQVVARDIVPGLGNGYVAFADVGALPKGAYVAGFTGMVGTVSGIYLQRFASDGSADGGPVLVTNAPLFGGSSNEAVAGLSNGNVAVAWLGADRTVHVQVLGAGSTQIGGDVTLGNDSSAYDPAITSLSDGGFLASWQEQVYDYNLGRYVLSLHVQRFDASGNRVNEEMTLPATVDTSGHWQILGLPRGGFALYYGGMDGNGHVQRYEDGHAFPDLPALTGDANPNTLVFTGTEAVKISGAAGNDVLTGSTGADLLDGGAGTDTLTGGAGDDTYVADTLDTIVELAAGGIDTVRIGGNYTLDRNIEKGWLTGSGNFNLTGNSGANRLIGNVGANVLNGGGGTDTMEGGAGDDTYVVDRAGDIVREDPGGGIDSVTSSATYTLSANVENLRLAGSQNLNGTGNALDNRIVGNGGSNILDGGAGNDLLIGGAGDDIYVVDGGDTLQEDAGAGVDQVESSASATLGDNLENLALTGSADSAGTGNELSNNIMGNAGNNVLNGMAGIDTVDGGEGSDTVYVDNSADVAVDSGWNGTDTVRAAVSYRIGNGIENLVLTGTLAIDGTGNDANNRIAGNAANNVLVGGAGRDELIGGAGNDTLYAGAIGETIPSGTDDELAGGTGNDTYYLSSDSALAVERAGEGTDTVYAAVDTAYTLGANLENLVLLGIDVDAIGNGLANSLTGTSGSNVLDGAAGADTLRGLGGDDTYIVDNAGDKVVEAAAGGVDKVVSTVSFTLGAELENLQLAGAAAIAGSGNALNNRITGNRAANALSGGAGNDTLIGGGGADKIAGGDGNDIVYAGGGETIDGGLGTDTVTYAGIAAGVKVDLALTTAQNAVGTLRQTLAGIENVSAGSGNDTVRGNDLGNRLQGNDGDDLLDGLGGNDVLYGGENQDILTGGLGNDYLAGGSGIDSAGYFAAATGVTVNLALQTAQNTVGAGTDTLTGIENLLGSDTGNDILTGDADDNILRGYGGNDRLDGGDGDNLLDGRDGNDVFIVHLGTDIVEGGKGIDLVDYSAALEGVTVMLASGSRINTAGLGYAPGHDVAPGYLPGATSTVGTVRGGGNDTLFDIENVNGSRFDDLIVGGDGANVLDGRGGADRMMGEGGNDTYYVDSAGDIVVEATAGSAGGTDTVYATVSLALGANVENLRLTAATAINGTGNTLNNTIVGGAGANVLAGGAGKDTLTGGAGKDVFVFNSKPDAAANVDTITDFVAADDTIRLENAIFTRLAATGNLNASYLRIGTAAADANDYIVYNGATGALSYDADGSGAGKAVQIATLTGHPALTSADFVVI